MSFWQLLKCVIIIVLLISFDVNANNRSDDILKVLKSNSESISSYSLSGEFCIVDVSQTKFSMIVDIIDEANRVTSNDYNITLNKILTVINDDMTWTKYNIKKKGNRYKSQQYETSDKLHLVSCFDGEKYVNYLPSSTQKQVDIYSEESTQLVFSLEQLDISLTDLFLYDYDYSDEDNEFTFKAKEGFSTKIQLDDNLATKHVVLTDISEGRELLKTWHLNVEKIDSYSMPRLILNANIQNEIVSLWIYKLDEIKINCEVTEQEIALGQLPLWATVVDHRTNPVSVEQLIPAPGTSLEKIDFDRWLDELDQHRVTDNIAEAKEIKKIVKKEETIILSEESDSVGDSRETTSSEIDGRNNTWYYLILIVVVPIFIYSIHKKRNI